MLRHSLKHLVETIDSFARVKQTPISIQHLIHHGSTPSKRALLLSSQFVHNELCIRFAHRISELQSMPFEFPLMPSVSLLRDRYIQSFEDLANFPTIHIDSSRQSFMNYSLGSVETSRMFKNIDLHKISEDLSDVANEMEIAEMEKLKSRFVILLETIKKRHELDLVTLAQGIKELREHLSLDLEHLKLDSFLNPFNRGRIGIGLLIGQNIALEKGPKDSKDGQIGLVSPKCNIKGVVSSAADASRYICLRHYPDVMPPDIRFDIDSDLTFPYIPSVLYYICFELFKNSLRATVEFHKSKKVPEVLVVARGHGEDLSMKISDQGGGIDKNSLSKIWTYTYTTANPKLIKRDFLGQKTQSTPMAGFGYGLPISKLYAQYLGGDLDIRSVAGYGSDAYLSLNRIGDVLEKLD